MTSCFFIQSQVPVVPSEEEQGRIHPPCAVASSDDLIVKPNLDRDKYYIRRSDAPGLYWKVILEQKSLSSENPSEVNPIK